MAPWPGRTPGQFPKPSRAPELSRVRSHRPSRAASVSATDSAAPSASRVIAHCRLHSRRETNQVQPRPRSNHRSVREETKQRAKRATRYRTRLNLCPKCCITEPALLTSNPFLNACGFVLYNLKSAARIEILPCQNPDFRRYQCLFRNQLVGRGARYTSFVNLCTPRPSTSSVSLHRWTDTAEAQVPPPPSHHHHRLGAGSSRRAAVTSPPPRPLCRCASISCSGACSWWIEADGVVRAGEAVFRETG